MSKSKVGTRCIDRFVPDHDKKAASALVKECLKRGRSVSVSDGEEWVLKRSIKYFEIMEVLASTESDTLLIRDGDIVIGRFWLIYGNGPEDMLIADHTANDECESIYNAVKTKLGFN